MRITRKHTKAPKARGSYSEREIVLYDALLDEGFDVIKQYAFEYEAGTIHVDLAIPKFKLVIEVDGKEHKSHKRLLSDVKRDKTIESQGWKLLRVTNQEVNRDIQSVIRNITVLCK